MQGAADGMLREALDCYDDGAIEDSDLSVIGLALEQFHHAVADRRAVIGAGDTRPAADARPPDLIDQAAFPQFFFARENLAGRRTGPAAIRGPATKS